MYLPPVHLHPQPSTRPSRARDAAFSSSFSSSHLVARDVYAPSTEVTVAVSAGVLIVAFLAVVGWFLWRFHPSLRRRYKCARHRRRYRHRKGGLSKGKEPAGKRHRHGPGASAPAAKSAGDAGK